MDQRPDPDALLARVQADEAKQRRGKLKIFFGAAPGVGKTYAMLEAARKTAKDGADVVIGYVEPHARPETQALVLGLDILPKRRVPYHGRELLDLNLTEALARKPQIIVVDELAHTNAVPDEPAAGGELVHAKRWQDVEALLAAGIDVYSTVNVQHLESLNDIVAKITGVIVRETLPDNVFEQADEVELVDLPPDDLIGRLREGKVYVPGQAASALEHFFNKGNLIALRELALRKMAERVDRQMTDYRTGQAIEDTWPAAERLLVCVTPGPTSASLVRATRRMAAGLRIPWLAAHVETPADARLTPDDRQRLAETLHLAQRLGGEVVTLGGADAPAEIIAYARQRNVTKIIVGKTLQPRWRELLRGSFVNELARQSGDIDVYVIRGETTPRPPATPATPLAGSRLAGFGWAAVSVLVSTGLCWLLSLLFPRAGEVTLCMVYLAGVVAVAARLGRGPAIVAALLGVLAFDVFFVPPFGTIAISDTQYIFTFAVMLATGVVIGTLTSRLAFAAEWSRRREQASAALGEFLRGLVEIDELAQLTGVRASLEHVVGGAAWVLVPSEAGLQLVAISQGELGEHERAVADWVYQHGEPAGLGTDTLPSVSALFVPLASADKVCGVLGVRPLEKLSRIPPEQLRLIEAAAGQLALAVQRIRAAEVARQTQLRFEREQLRSSLLSAVSHDFRTPLAAIAGAGSTLVEAGHVLSHETRQELAESIVAETDRLNRLVANLLDMTRLDAGSLQLDRQWHPPGELVGAVIRRLSRLLEGRRLSIDVPADLPLVYLDELLFHQVLVNLLENAVRYTPPKAEIAVTAGLKNAALWFEVADNGPGIKPGDEERLFEKFYRSQQRSGSGAGLGLAICRGIVELHGGTIRAANRAGGAVFRIEMPQPPQPAINIPAEPAAV